MKYFKLSISLLVFVVVFVSCSKEPKLTREHMEWKLSADGYGFVTDDQNFPLEFVGDGYKMIKLSKIETKEATHYRVLWGWKYTLKNISKKSQRVTITYILEDVDGFKITTDSGEVWLEPGEEDTIQETSTISYEDSLRVSRRSWTVRHVTYD